MYKKGEIDYVAENPFPEIELIGLCKRYVCGIKRIAFKSILSGKENNSGCDCMCWT